MAGSLRRTQDIAGQALLPLFEEERALCSRQYMSIVILERLCRKRTCDGIMIVIEDHDPDVCVSTIVGRPAGLAAAEFDLIHEVG